MLLAGCGGSDFWDYDAVLTYHPEFDSRRLTHRPSNGYPPWKIELFKAEEGIEMFISLLQHQFRPSAQNSSEIPVILMMENQEMKVEGAAFLLDGHMKLRFSDFLATTFIQALQEGKKVSILIDAMQETVEPELFKEKFSMLMKAGYDWNINIQTPLK